MKEFFLRYGFLCMLGFFILATIIMISPLGAVIRRGFSVAVDGVKNSPVAALFKSNETIDVTTEDMQNFRIVVHSKKETDE